MPYSYHSLFSVFRLSNSKIPRVVAEPYTEIIEFSSLRKDLLKKRPSDETTVYSLVKILFAEYHAVLHDEKLYIFHRGVLSTIADATSCMMPHDEQRLEDIVKQLAIDIGMDKFDIDHYFYLDKVLDDFWVEVFGKSLKDTWNEGIVTAHGDKAYGYKRKWEKAGVPFFHGVTLYLLTYTDKLDREKYNSDQFVIDHYPKYREVLEKIDQKHGFKIQLKG